MKRAGVKAVTLSVVFERSGDWILAFIPELPGVMTQGRTLKEARENLREAAQLVLWGNRRIGARALGSRTIRRERVTIPL